jgi:hypothetical protein
MLGSPRQDQLPRSQTCSNGRAVEVIELVSIQSWTSHIGKGLTLAVAAIMDISAVPPPYADRFQFDGLGGHENFENRAGFPSKDPA